MVPTERRYGNIYMDTFSVNIHATLMECSGENLQESLHAVHPYIKYILIELLTVLKFNTKQITCFHKETFATITLCMWRD